MSSDISRHPERKSKLAKYDVVSKTCQIDLAGFGSGANDGQLCTSSTLYNLLMGANSRAYKIRIQNGCNFVETLRQLLFLEMNLTN